MGIAKMSETKDGVVGPKIKNYNKTKTGCSNVI